jgi:hypothetical protein
MNAYCGVRVGENAAIPVFSNIAEEYVGGGDRIDPHLKDDSVAISL